jgi:photosystem II stability/assembly factor-like uncharacterized protein/uncharacterized protein YjbI with pentapeptide repeats
MSIITINNINYLLGPYIDLSNLDLTNINFSNYDLTGANFNNSIVIGVNLNNIILSNANLTNIVSNNIIGIPAFLPIGWKLLYGILYAPSINLIINNINYSLIPNGDFSNLDLSGQNLNNIDLTGVNFTNTNLTGCNLTGTNLNNTILVNTNFNNTILSNTSLFNSSSNNIIGTPTSLPLNWQLVNGKFIGPIQTLVSLILSATTIVYGTTIEIYIVLLGNNVLLTNNGIFTLTDNLGNIYASVTSDNIAIAYTIIEPIEFITSFFGIFTSDDTTIYSSSSETVAINIIPIGYNTYGPTLTIKANSFTKYYDGQIFILPTVTYNGFIDGDTYLSLSGLLVYSGSYLNTLQVGIYNIIPSGLISNKYYIIFINGNLSILQTNLNISINNYVKIYNGFSDMPNYIVNYSGLIADENYTILNGILCLSGNFISAINVGNYNIIPSGLSAVNYNIIYINSILTINTAQLLIIANNVTKIYDKNIYIGGEGVIYDGFKNNDSNNNLTGYLTYSGNSQGANIVGNYIIIPSGLSSQNYNIIFINGTLTIYTNIFLIKANDFIKYYNALFYSNPTVSYIGDITDLSGSLTFYGTYPSALDPNNYTIQTNGLTSPNYIINYYQGVLTINKAEIYIKANSYYKIYDAIPFTDITVTYIGLLGNDNSNNFSGNLKNLGTSYGITNIGIYNIIPSNLYSNNYSIIYEPGTLTIIKKPLYINTRSYTKIYDSTTDIDFSQGDIIYSISGIINNEIIYLYSYSARYHSQFTGYQLVDISNITLSGLTLNNYYIVSVPPISSTILPKIVTANFSGGNKIYDTLNIAGTLLNYSIDGIIISDILTISNYTATFRDINIGRHIVDVSNIVFSGPNIYQYVLPKHVTFYASIYPKYLDLTFNRNDKIYDATHKTNYLTASISGIMGYDIITISSYFSRYKNDNVGLQIVDISFVILYGNKSRNYAINNIFPISTYIYPKQLLASFNGGGKIYDGTTFTSLILGSLSGMLEAEYYYSTDLSSVFMIPNVNITVLGSYNISPYLIDTNNNSKNIWYIYSIGTESNLYFDQSNNLIVDSVNSYFYQNNNILGSNSIYYDISNINIVKMPYLYVDISSTIIDINAQWIWSNYQETTVQQFQGLYNNFIKNFLYGTIYINANANTTIYFNGYYLGSTDNLYQTFKFPILIYPGTNIILINASAYDSNPGLLITIIDNITNNVLLNSNNLWVYSIDQNIIQYNYFSFKSIIENITINSFTSFYKTEIIGLKLIDISNIVIIGQRVNNYIITPVPAINATITRRNLIATFYNGSKIYDSTFNTGPMFYSLSGLINISVNNIFQNNLENVSISSFTSQFNYKEIGYNSISISISNLILQGLTSKNYRILPINSINANIYKKSLIAIFTGGDKIYDATNYCGPILNSLIGIAGLDNVSISTFIPFYKSVSVGITLIDISNVILQGSDNNNYYILPVPPLPALINYKALIATFSGGNKIYDSTYVCGPIGGSLSGIIGFENISISTFISTFHSNNIGSNLIDISSLVIQGTTIENYIVLPIPAFNSYINYKDLFISFVGGSKIYDSYRNAGNTIFGTISGIIGSEVVTISNFVAMYQDQNIGLRFIDISNIILSGPTAINYNILPVNSIANNINNKLLVATFTGGSKIYDGTTFCGPMFGSLSGIIGQENITISTFISFYESSSVGINLIYIQNIIVQGITSNNYYTIPAYSLALIDYRPLIANFEGGYKTYDSTNVCGPMFGSLSGIIGFENISISSFVRVFRSNNSGNNLIDISNIIIQGRTYKNYIILPTPALNSFIDYRNLVISFTGGTKNYDSYRNANSSIIGTISGLYGLEIATISSFVAMFKDQNVGPRFIDISDIILTGPTLFNYNILPVIYIRGYINYKLLVATFIGGSKTYDGTNSNGTLIGSLSGVIGLEIINISSFTSFYQSINVGINLINIGQIVIQGLTSFNYNIIPVMPLASTIYARNLTITYLNGSKKYDGNIIPGFSLFGTISNSILSDNIKLNYYISAFRSPNAGPNIIDISFVSITGQNVSNYFILPIVPLQSYISTVNLTAIFTGGVKIYDSTQKVNSLNYSLVGVVNNDNITISSYSALFRNTNVGSQFIDISNIIFNTILNNYTLNPIISITSYINLKNIYIQLTGGSKIYDKTLNTGPIIATLSGIMNNENVIVLSFSSIFASYLAGLQLINISNIVLSGNTLANYSLQPIIPLYSNIYQRSTNINFNGGNKAYDGTLKTGKINGFFDNSITSDFLPIDNITASFLNPNVGLNSINVQSVLVGGSSGNYIFIIQSTLSSYIYQKIIQAIFSGGNKTYDKQYSTGSISGILLNTIITDDVSIISFQTSYRNNTIGTQIIDISNIIIGGIDSLNYILNPQLPINGYINKAQLTAIFSASDKTYNGNNIPNNVNYLLNNYQNDQVFISSYNIFYYNSNIGNQRIDISTAIITGSDSYNYTLLNIQSFYSNIIGVLLTVTFFNGNKIYDATTNTNKLLYSISGIIYDYIYLKSYTATFRSSNVGNQIIDILNVTIGGLYANNYTINPTNPLFAIIFQKNLSILFTNLNKIYDATQNSINTISGQIIGLVGNDNLTILSLTGIYRNYNIGITFLDISNVILFGPSANNYIITPIQSLIAQIYPRLIGITFNGGDKIYDKTNTTGVVNYILSNIISNQTIIITSFTSLFKNVNVGLVLIDISNVILAGSTINNYYITPSPPISANIYAKQVLISFTSINKTYDNTSYAYVINPTISGLINSDILNITISSYLSFYVDKFVQNNKINYVNNIILFGKNANNYIVNPPTIISYSNIIPKQIYLIATGVTKIYDQTTNATLSNIYLSGYFIDDILYLDISSYITNYVDINATYNKQINITNIILNGQYSYNYYINSTFTLGNILTKNVLTYFTGINKNFDGNTLATVNNYSISYIIYPDSLIIYSYKSNFIDANVGINKTITIIDISFSGFSSSNYSTSSSFTIGTITYPTSLSILLTSNTINYRDVSNYILLNINPIWDILSSQISSLLIGIYQNIIISNNGSIFNLINNKLITIYSSNNIFNNLVMTDLNIGFICGNNGLIISTTNGFITTTISNYSIYNFNSISQIFNNTAFSVGNNGSIFKTINSGLSWSIITYNTTVNLNDVYIIDNNMIFIVGNNGLLLTSNDSGVTWISKIINNNNLNSIKMIDQFNGYIVGDNGLMLKTNDGNKWNLMLDISNNIYTNYKLNNIFIFDLNDIMIVGDNGTILGTNNRGLNWKYFTSGTVSSLTKIFMYSLTNIIIIGSNGLILSYLTNPQGQIQLYDNNNLIKKIDNSSTLIYNMNNLIVNSYLINGKFVPYQISDYGLSYTSINNLFVKPIINFATNITNTNYDRTDIIYSTIPLVDQSGGLFTILDYVGSIVQQLFVTINTLTGQIQFKTNINVNNYTFRIIYTLNNLSNQQFYNFIVYPNFYYPNNQTFLIYNTDMVSSSPYFNQPNGLFLINLSGSFISINSLTGIISFSNLIPINNYIITVTYTLNYISITTQYFLNIISKLNYSINVTNLNYSTYGNSVIPTISFPNGNFLINDLSSNLITLNKVSIGLTGIILFNNNIDVGIYNFIITYIFNGIKSTTIYYLNALPYLAYPEKFRVIEYNHTIYDASSFPIVFPTGGLFSITDISGLLVSQNLITIDANLGQLIFNNIGVNSYIFMITYLYNYTVNNIYYSLQIKPSVNYSINNINLIYNVVAFSIAPYINPLNGTFTIYELDNILVQTKYVNINYLTGIINFTAGIAPGTYNFGINYIVNNIYNTTYYKLIVSSLLLYSPKALFLSYGVSDFSVLPTYSPIGGVFTILVSEIFNQTLISINTASISININTGVISFLPNINVGYYNLSVNYAVNNINNLFIYNLTIRPIIYYNILTTILLYERSIINYSIVPFVNQKYGTFTIIDNSSNMINLVPNYVYIDLSGIIYFNTLIDVGLYYLTINYTLNNINTSIIYNLIIKPNIFYPFGNIYLIYDRILNYYTERPIVNQSGGNFTIFGLASYTTIDNFGIINISPNINVGSYFITVTYTLLNSFNTTIYNIIIQPNIYYSISSIITNYGTTVISKSPYYKQLGGLFTISPNIVTINQFGIITFDNNINVGNYNFLINYNLNNIVNQTVFNYIVIPTINYSILKTILLYNNSTNSVTPTYLQLFGLFSIFDISGYITTSGICLSTNFPAVYNKFINIDSKTGIIYFNTKLNVGIYYLNVIYTLNNISNNIVYELDIIPFIVYNISFSKILYDHSGNIYSTSPNYDQSGGIFSIVDNLGNLVNNNIVFIDNLLGILTFIPLINVGLYSFNIIYLLNNLTNFTTYNLSIIPNIIYTPAISIINYNDSLESSIPYYNQENGNFTITDIIGNLIIIKFVKINNSNGIISFQKAINVGYYKFLIKYTLNGVFNITQYELYILPNINYSVNIKNLNYGVISKSVFPIVTQINGIFSIYDLSNNAVQQNSVLIDIYSGIISFSDQINVGIYALNIIYLLNNVSSNIIYYLNVYPTINYLPNSQSILFNRTFNNQQQIVTSFQPDVMQPGGVFYILNINDNSNNIFNIDSSGIIFYKNYDPVGIYNINIIYILNNLSVLTSYKLNIIPNLVYKSSYITLLYNESFISGNPYFDQSGGSFIFSDISGYLITKNIISYDISYGLFYFIKSPNVGIYNLNIKYSLNNIYNIVNVIFYILPIVKYNINSSIYLYNTNNYSIEPTANQPEGIYTLIENSYNDLSGIIIDSLTGILNFSPTVKINIYVLTIIYTLNLVSNFTIYNLQIMGILYYKTNYYSALYNNFINSEVPVFDPPNGIFSIIPNIKDISSYDMIIADISNGLIYIDPVNGIINFNQNLTVGIYLLTINYMLNNAVINTNLTYVMNPFLSYLPNNIQIAYGDISYSSVPYVIPTNGVFSASIPFINIGFSGISIDKKSGILNFGRINAGTWNITVKYTINNTSVISKYTTLIDSSILYTPSYLTIPVNTLYATNIPVKKQFIPNNGIFSSISSILGYSIDPQTGVLNFNNIIAGVYLNIPIIYYALRTQYIIAYSLIIQPSLVYDISSFNSFYTIASQSIIPQINPFGGIFNSTLNNQDLTPLPSSITIDLSGIIRTDNTLNVGIYYLLINYTYNSSTITIPYIINIYPNLNYLIDNIAINYESLEYSEIPIKNPSNGIFSSNTKFFVDTSGIIQFNNTTMVGIYNIPIIYTLNLLSTIKSYNLVVYPIYYYTINFKNVIINMGGQSIKPIAKQTQGIFSFISISSTLQIGYGVSFLSSGNQYIQNGIILNGYSGIINFGNHILVGNYILNLMYTLNNLSATTVYYLTVLPYINYKISNLTLDYKTFAISSLPIVDQSGGFFYFSNISDLNNQLNYITINNRTGVINFINGLETGLYNINIAYIINQIQNSVLFNLIIQPIYYYQYSTTILTVNSIGYSNLPTTIQQGGIFNIINFDNLTNDLVSIDQNTGILSFNNILIGIYNFILNYSLNNATITTTYQLIITPYFSYDINNLNIPYTFTGYSTYPSTPYLGGMFGFEDITSLRESANKIRIDISFGQIYFNNLINSGNYPLVINYIYNGIKFTNNYILNVLPLFNYTISGISLDYNHTKFNSSLPVSNPIAGIYYFNDNSNNFPINEILLDKNTGCITITKLMVGNYNIGISYYLKQFKISNKYIITILPTFYYSSTYTTLMYSNSNTYSTIPTVDPMGGIFNIIYPINNNLLYKININNNGQLIFSNLIEINTYNFNISYTYNNNTTFIQYNLLVKPLFYYLETIKKIFYGTDTTSSTPIIYPKLGKFSISNINIDNINGNLNINSINEIYIDPNIGIIYINNLLSVGNYYLTITYNNIDIITSFNYLIQIMSKISYDVSNQTIIYGNIFYASNSNLYKNSFYQIDSIYNNIGIFIDQSSGILTFNSNVNVNYYPINILYNILNINGFTTFNLLVIPYISYDISNIILTLNDSLKNTVRVNPYGGIFTTNYGSIDLSGTLKINNLTVNKYKINIQYIVNKIANSYNINLSILPIIYYQNIITLNTYKINNYSSIPFTNPNRGLFYLDVSNITINSNGIINFDPNQNIGKFNIKINYNVNNQIQYTYYNYYVIPFINYQQSFINIIGGKIGTSQQPIVYPFGGNFIISYYNGLNINIDNSGIIFFNNNIPIGIYNLIVNYSFDDLSSNFIYKLTVTPYIYYDFGIFNYGNYNKSKLPLVNSYGGLFSLTFDYNLSIQINLITLDISSGLINISPSLAVGNYYFYINYLYNKFIFTFTYAFKILPVLIYSNHNLNHNTSLSILPLFINPYGGFFSINNIPNFITLVNPTGEIIIKNANMIGRYNIIVSYFLNNISISSNIIVNINPVINFTTLFSIIYLSTGNLSLPYVSISGGTYFADNLPNGLSLNQYTGIFSYSSVISVNIFNIKINYLLFDVSGYGYLNLTVLPYFNYLIGTSLIYGISGISNQPNINPKGGNFSLLNNLTNIYIDSSSGILTFGSTFSVNIYKISVNYSYNNITSNFIFTLLINKKIILADFIASDKIFDGTLNVKFKSNKLIGVINNDKVYINSYQSTFQTIGPNLDINIFVTNLILGGQNAYNYNLQYDNLAIGNIYLVVYSPNNLKINQEIAGNSITPVVSPKFFNSLFLITNISVSGLIDYVNVTGITIDSYGTIFWDNTLAIAIYYISIYVYNNVYNTNIIFTLEVTKNLYQETLDVILPKIPNILLETSLYQAQYSSTKGLAYIIDNNIPGLIGTFSITAYDSLGNITHNLENNYPFIFQLSNANPKAKLVAYELNDDTSINYSEPYKLTYLNGNNWLVSLIYLSDFHIVDLSAMKNTPPKFYPLPGTIYSFKPVKITLTALPHSIIYYTLDGSIPTINSLIFLEAIEIKSNIVITTFSVTLGYANSLVVTGNYIVYNNPCLLSKTLIRTPYGNELIDNLKNGDLIVTGDNRIVPIIKIIKYEIENPDDESYPICIPKNYFSNNVPDRNTYISNNHAIKLNDTYWIYGNHHKNYFAKYKTIPIYYHILLPNYFTDDLIANNLIVESWSGLLYENKFIVYRRELPITFNNAYYFVFKKYNIKSKLVYRNYKT